MTVRSLDQIRRCQRSTNAPSQSFSSLLSSLGDKHQAPQTSTATSTKPAARPVTSDRFKLTPNNAAAGQKRRSEEPESQPRQKIVKVGPQNPSSGKPAPSSRFQLSSTKPSAATRPASSPQRPTDKRTPSSLTVAQASNGASNTSSNATAAKRGFASILEKAKAAQDAAKASNSGAGIVHKPAERLSKKDRLRMREEALAQRKAGKAGQPDRSRSGTPLGAKSSTITSHSKDMIFKGTAKKKTAVPLSYKGTMRAEGTAAKAAPPKKGAPKDEYGGYASWSDLDDAEDLDEEEEEDYGSDSDDMEGGFDDLQAEEMAALRAAKKEDDEALEEEARLKKEKMERQRRLQALSKNAASKKRY